MERYYSQKTTPLGFHKFIKYVSLPCGILFTIINIANAARTISEYSGIDTVVGLATFELLLLISDLAVIVVCFVGFIKWTKYGLYGLFAHLGILAFYSFYYFIVCAAIAPSSIGKPIGLMLVYIPYIVLVGIYYYKRMALFGVILNKAEPEGTACNCDFEKQYDSFNHNFTITHMSVQKSVAFCRKCGNKLIPNSVFCNKCGFKIDKF